MFNVTCINLEEGGSALYINGHYLVSDDGCGESFSLSELLQYLSRLPGVTTETVERPEPDSDDWSWNDVAESVFPVNAVLFRDRLTVEGFKQRLSQFPDTALCCGTFWLADDFLQLDSSLSDEEIEAAMDIAQDNHDAGIGFNWEHLQWAVDEVKRG